MKKMPGFTLFEIVIVVFIMSGMAVFGIVSLFRLQNIFSLRSSADEIRAIVQHGRELAKANKDQAQYRIVLFDHLLELNANTSGINSYRIPTNTTISPDSFVWDFTPITGTIPTCSPCQLNLSLGGVSEVITVNENGLIN